MLTFPRLGMSTVVLMVCSAISLHAQGDPLAREDAYFSKNVMAIEMSNVASVACDSRANAYILDRYNHQVVVITPSGRRLRVFGRRGWGPGELQDPVALDVSRNRVYVADHGRSSVAIYDLDGQFQGSVPGAGRGLHPRAISVNESGEIAELEYSYSGPQSRPLFIRHRSNALDTLAWSDFADGNVHLSNGRRVAIIQLPLGPQVHWILAGDQLIVADGTSASVEVLNERGTRAVPLPFSAPPLPAKEKDAAVARLHTLVRHSAQALDLAVPRIQSRDVPTGYPPVLQLDVDAKSHLWVLGRTSDARAFRLIKMSTGLAVERRFVINAFPQSIHSMSICGESMYLAVQTPDGQRILRRYILPKT